MKHKFALCVCLSALISAGSVQGAAESSIDVTALSIEQLLNTDFIPASRIAQQISDAPSAVSVVTANDIKNYGYRTLADVLNSMRGLYVTRSFDYEYLGGRSFGVPGDYAGRIMLVIDGVVANENVYDQVFLGEDAYLDIDMIDRVEFVPGPGSTTYGNSAFLGSVHVTTKSGGDLNGVEVEADFGSHSSQRKRISYGKQFDNDVEVLLSASRYEDDGVHVLFPALDGWEPASGDPYSNQTVGPFKKNKNDRLFLKGRYGNWSIEAASVSRDVDNSTFLTFLEPADFENNSKIRDRNSFVTLSYHSDFGAALKSSTQLYAGQYQYDSSEVTSADFLEQHSTGRWLGVDAKFIGTWFEQHRILFGAEYRNNYQQDFSETLTADYYEGYVDGFNSRREIYSVYLQDEYRVAPQFTVTTGVRYDDSSKNGDALSPRIAFIYQPFSQTTLKLSYGKAFRYVNPWEVYSGFTPEEYDKEQVTTSEVVWQQKIATHLQLTAAYFRNDIDDAINFFFNEQKTNGHELGVDYLTEKGWSARFSIAHQDTRVDLGDDPINAPHFLGKLNLTSHNNVDCRREFIEASFKHIGM